MGIGILAPVPAVLLPSAIETCEREGRVAFGTNAIDLFLKINEQYGSDLPVIIQPTVGYGDPNGYGRFSFGATYIGFVKANHRGLHPNPAVRPSVTLDDNDPDSPVVGFWEIKGLCRRPRRVELHTLMAEGKKTPFPKNFILHGPTLVKAPFL